MFRGLTLEQDYGRTRLWASLYVPRLCVRTPPGGSLCPSSLLGFLQSNEISLFPTFFHKLRKKTCVFFPLDQNFKTLQNPVSPRIALLAFSLLWSHHKSEAKKIHFVGSVSCHTVPLIPLLLMFYLPLYPLWTPPCTPLCTSSLLCFL